MTFPTKPLNIFHHTLSVKVTKLLPNVWWIPFLEHGVE